MSEMMALTDDDILRFTQATRKKLVDSIVQDGLPTDNKDRVVLLTALADMDRTALGNKKIGAAESIAEADRIAASAIAQINRQMAVHDPFARGASSALLEGDYTYVSGPEADDRQLPILGDVELESEQGLSTMNYDQFTKMMDGE